MANATYDIVIDRESTIDQVVLMATVSGRHGDRLPRVPVRFRIAGQSGSFDKSQDVKEVAETTNPDGEASVTWTVSPRSNRPQRLTSTVTATCDEAESIRLEAIMAVERAD